LDLHLEIATRPPKRIVHLEFSFCGFCEHFFRNLKDPVLAATLAWTVFADANVEAS
jgi:hypothetical protein